MIDDIERLVWERHWASTALLELGIVLHSEWVLVCIAIDSIYLGNTFGRPFANIST